MRAVAYIPLHYGKEYLKESIQSVEPFVEDIHVLYTERPSYGRTSNAVCPDTEEELREIATKASPKIQWHKIVAFQENKHRQQVDRFAKDADIILPIDADEIWDKPSLEKCLKEAENSTAKRFGVLGFIHFWKSFNFAVQDQFTPIRLIKTKGEDRMEIIKGTIYHFGYCQNSEIINYKWTCHGHQDELREGWLDMFENWTDEDDVHPTSIGLWNPQPFDRTTLPEALKKHPRYE